MNVKNPKERIWNNLRNAERMSRYYSRRSQQLDSQYKWITFPIAFIPVAALVILQGDWENKYELASIILFVTAVLEVSLLHFRIGGDIKAAKVTANQTTKLAQEWRKLWIDPDRDNIVHLIELLEGITVYATAESISHPRFLFKNRLRNQCAKDANHALSIQFGG